jgi:hypothetical protein
VDGALSGGVIDNGALLFDLSSAAPSATTVAATLTGSGSLVMEGGGTLVMSGGDAFTGSTLISASGGTLELSSSGAVGTGPITFGSGLSATLRIDGSTMPTNVISGFAPGDTIDFAGIAFDSSGRATLLSGNVLQIVESGHISDLNLDPAQVFVSPQFDLSRDISGGTDVTLAPTVNPPPPAGTAADMIMRDTNNGAFKI